MIEWPDYTRPQTLNGWVYAEDDPENRVDPTGHFSCVFATNNVENRILRQLGWASCNQGVDHVLDILDNDGGQYSATVVWAFRDADSKGGVGIRFTDPPQAASPNGWRDWYPPYQGHVEIDGKGVPADLLSPPTAMSLSTLAYISVLVHEFWHATMQIEGTANLSSREGEAFGVQTKVLEELHGDPKAIALLRSISKDPTSVGYNDNIVMEARACWGILLALGPFGDNATWERWIEVHNRLEK